MNPEQVPDVQTDASTTAGPSEASSERDVFISHAGEDKEDVARPLAEALTSAGWTADACAAAG